MFFIHTYYLFTVYCHASSKVIEWIFIGHIDIGFHCRNKLESRLENPNPVYIVEYCYQKKQLMYILIIIFYETLPNTLVHITIVNKIVIVELGNSFTKYNNCIWRIIVRERLFTK